uniref:Uncharacterized protein n=1 Tax=viral metagenome TaxID=1070528 RepID=A0A6C0E0N3_9ZZZZ
MSRRRAIRPDDLPLLLSPPKNPKGFTKPYFDPDFEIYRSVAKAVPNEEVTLGLEKKCKEMHKDMNLLLKKISKRQELERKYDRIENKIKDMDREIEELHSQLREKY